jgi:hypothetical protein
MRIVTALAFLLTACSPAVMGDPVLDVRALPAASVDVTKGSVAIQAVATDAAGKVGRGTVSFSSDVGMVSATSGTLDEFGKAEITFACLAGMHAGCDTQSSATVTAKWETTPPVTATRRITLRRPMPPSADGGAGTPCSNQNDCQSGLACFDGTCVGAGALRFSLSWTAQSDFDLHVITPMMNHIYFANRREDGGDLDVDACVIQAQCRPTNVENVYWRASPPTGTYRFYVVNFNGRAAGAFRIQVAGPGVAPQEFTGMLPASSMAQSMDFTITR